MAGDPFEGVELSPEQQAELATLRRGWWALNGMVSDPKNGVTARRLLKTQKGFEHIVVPEDVAAPFVAQVDEKLEAFKTDHTQLLDKITEAAKTVDEKISAFDQREKDRADIADLGSKIDAAVRHYRFTNEGRDALIQHMKDTNTPDPMTAGAFLVQNMERPQPAASNGMAPEVARANGAPDVDLFSVAGSRTEDLDESLRLLHGTPKQQDLWMRREIDKVLAEGAEAA